MDMWLGPAGRDFFDGVYDALHNCHEHCAAVIPERLQRGFRSALLRFAQEWYGQIRIATLNPSISLLANLENEFCVADKKPRDVKELSERHLREGQILALNFPCKTDAWRDEYLSYLKWISADAKRRKDTGEVANWSLLCILPPGHDFKTDSGMRIMEWWGRHYPSDLEFAIERALRPQNLGRPAYTWYYAICRGLGDAAPDLVEYLARLPLTDMESITTALAKHELCDAEIAKLAKRYGVARCSRSMPPTGEARRLWNVGAFDISCQGEPTLHPAAMVACKLPGRLLHLVVSGQMQVYLPMAQQVFHWLIKRTREKIGDDWLNSIPEKPDSIGKLAWTIGNYFRNEAEEELSLANCWKDARNNIAHGKFIPFNLAMNAVLEYDKLSGKLSADRR